ncbi:hypothetical protein HAZT_HAZT007696 [Hyalella azteca]|uniref:Uncharacterized protein n=1 Tax=Hyalella azteca TaxID=294128 RepID=A0A6A0H6G1_HYAAZ|nr:hypothetical protein HAZT_HAZT007696 [Hyalella azteca]
MPALCTTAPCGLHSSTLYNSTLRSALQHSAQQHSALQHSAVCTAALCTTAPCELANAALKIQAGFRGHIARKQNKPTEELPSKMTGLNMKDDAADDIDIDLTDPEVNKAAIKIQATFRGHQIRKNH